MINVVSPCWRSIQLTTTWHDWYTDECVVNVLAEHATILLPGRCPRSINFHVYVLHLKIIHTLSSLQNLLGIRSSSATLLCNKGVLSVCIMMFTRTELIGQQQRQCQHLVRKRKGISQQQEHVNGVNANQRSNEVKYGRWT
jgi:hypothetical protein